MCIRDSHRPGGRCDQRRHALAAQRRPPAQASSRLSAGSGPGAVSYTHLLAAISLIPLIALKLFNANQNFPFGGTSILIIVGVGLETVKQIQAQLQQRNYEGFLR